MKFLGRIFSWSILLISLGLFVYVQSIKKNPCEVPLEYTLGTFDKRFNISEKVFLKEIEDATHIWENSLGKDLFEKKNEKDSPTGIKKYIQEYVGKYFIRGPIVINLIYDDRQKTADQQRVAISAINETKESADEIKDNFRILQKDYEKAKIEYQSLLSEYKQKRGDWNVLEDKRLEVNGLADEINALVKKYNFLVSSVNSTIKEINKTIEQEFEEGQYVYDKKGERINIYEFGSMAILERVLAHEFGHALGLDHNDNPNSIMYYLNSSDNISPTKEDIEGLKKICNGK